MRYFIEELIYDGSMIRCAGWAAPEDLSDRLTVTLQDEAGNLLPIPVEMQERPDVVEAIYGVKQQPEPYGFRFSFPPGEWIFVYLDLQAERFAIDHTRKRIEVRDLMHTYRKEHSFFGKMKKKRQEKERRKKEKKR